MEPRDRVTPQRQIWDSNPETVCGVRIFPASCSVLTGLLTATVRKFRRDQEVIKLIPLFVAYVSGESIIGERREDEARCEQAKCEGQSISDTEVTARKHDR